GHRDPHAIELFEHDPEGLDRALEHGRVGDIEGEALVLEQAPGGLRLPHAELAERHVHPAGEAVVEIPLALAVAQKHELGRHPRGQSSDPSLPQEPRGSLSSYLMRALAWGLLVWLNTACGAERVSPVAPAPAPTPTPSASVSASAAPPAGASSAPE